MNLEVGHSATSPVSIHDLTVAYHRKPVLWDVDLDIPEGKLVAIVGPNGAGKSTLIKAVLDIVPRASGNTFPSRLALMKFEIEALMSDFFSVFALEFLEAELLSSTITVIISPTRLALWSV